MTDKQQELHALLEKTIDEQVDNRVAEIQQENKDLKGTVKKLQDQVWTLVDERNDARNKAEDAKVLLEVIEIFKDRLGNIQEKAVRPEFVYNLLKLFFEPDFEESTYDCPIWLGAVVNFYSHRDIVVRLLKVLDIYVPNNIEKFRLPQDWTTEELDIVFATMGNHIVCNGCTYADNLRFWKAHALYDVYEICYNCKTYSEIPWQFLLRNPNLLNKKYLKKIGKMAHEEPHVSGWRYLFKIEDYQELTENQIKIIIDSINPYVTIERNKFKYVNEFLLEHIGLITNTSILDQLYEKYKDGYDFKYGDTILNMPAKYLEDFLTSVLSPTDAIQWVLSREKKMSKEQKDNLLKFVMSEVLK